MDTEKQKKILDYFFYTALLVSGVFFLRILLPFLPAIVLGATLVAIFYPLYRLFHQNIPFIKKRKDAVASVITVVIVIFVVIIPLVGITSLLSKQAFDFYKFSINFIAEGKLEDFITSHPTIDKNFPENISTINESRIGQFIKNFSETFPLTIYEKGKLIVENSIDFFIGFVVMIFVMFYLFKDGIDIRNYLFKISPLPEKDEQSIFQRFKDVSYAVFYGSVVTSLMQGIIITIFFFLWKIPAPIFWGTITVILALIPLLGTALVYFPAFCYLFFFQNSLNAFFFLVACIICVNSIEYLWKPKLIEDKLHIHSLFIFFGIAGGLKVFGLMGILYGPIIVTIFLSLVQIYEKDYNGNRI